MPEKPQPPTKKPPQTAETNLTWSKTKCLFILPPSFWCLPGWWHLRQGAAAPLIGRDPFGVIFHDQCQREGLSIFFSHYSYDNFYLL
jgi:hypothetical protein